MIENKETYYNRAAELANKKDNILGKIRSVDPVESLMRAYGTTSLAELKDRLNDEYKVAAAEYDDFTRERDETFDKICTEFGEEQVQNWRAVGYDNIDLVNLYLSGNLKKECNRMTKEEIDQYIVLDCLDGKLTFSMKAYKESGLVRDLIDNQKEWIAGHTIREVSDELEELYMK